MHGHAPRQAPIALLLMLLLAVTTPVGTGDGVHQTDLLHPLVPHVHLVNGHVVTHDPGPGPDSAPSATHTRGPAVGAGADAAQVVLGLSTVLPMAVLSVVADPPTRLVPGEFAAPPGRVEAPPDPP